jgi:large subunit ribosomal protein L35
LGQLLTEGRSNIPISHLHHQAIGTGAKKSDTIMEYLVPTVQKGIKYARFAVFIMEQEGKLDPELLKSKIQRENFNTRRFLAKNKCEIIGAHMWRNTWDEQMKDVMIRNNIPGWDKMYRRVKV